MSCHPYQIKLQQLGKILLRQYIILIRNWEHEQKIGKIRQWRPNARNVARLAARNTVPVEGKAMATGLGGIAHTELNPPEKEENVQERLEEVDKEMAGGYVNEENSGDESQGLKNRAKQFIMTVAVTSVVITTLTIYMLVLDDWGAYTGENGYASDFIQIIVRRTQSADMHPISYC